VTVEHVAPHSCFVVADLDAAMHSATGAFGLRFRKPASFAFRFERGDEVTEQLLRVTYTLDGTTEIVEGQPGGPFSVPTGGPFHHTGYTADDIDEAIAVHRARGVDPEWRVIARERLIAVLLPAAPPWGVPVEILNGAYASTPATWNATVSPGT